MAEYIDIGKLPEDVREKLAELDLELSEGDITQKGYEKKRTRLLQPYVSKQIGTGNGGIGGGGGDGGGVDKGLDRTSYESGGGGGGDGGGSGSYGGGRPQPRTRRTQRRVTHNEKRYHSGSAMHYVASEKKKTLLQVAR